MLIKTNRLTLDLASVKQAWFIFDFGTTTTATSQPSTPDSFLKADARDRNKQRWVVAPSSSVVSVVSWSILCPRNEFGCYPAFPRERQPPWHLLGSLPGIAEGSRWQWNGPGSCGRWLLRRFDSYIFRTIQRLASALSHSTIPCYLFALSAIKVRIVVSWGSTL